MPNWFKKNSKWAKYFVLGAALIIVYKTFDNLSSLWSGVLHVLSAVKPFLIAFVIAYMLNIPTKKLSGLLDKKVKNKFVKKHANAISIATVYVLAIAIVVLVIGSVIPAIMNELIDVYEHIPQYAGEIADFVNDFEPARNLGFTEEFLTSRLNGFVEKIISIDVVGYTKTLATGIVSVTSVLLNVFIAIIASIYMLIDKDRIIEGIKKWAKKIKSGGNIDMLINRWSAVNDIFTQYIYSRLICCSVMAVACTLVLGVMGEEYAVLLGIFIGFMDIIPYFGSIISWVAGLLLMAISGGWAHAIWCSAIILVLQQIDGNILAPKVTGSRLEIRPLTIIIAVSVGGTLFGFLGMLLSVPVVAILRLILTEILEDKSDKTDKVSSEKAEKNN